MPYSDITAIRKEAGFTGNTNIEDSDITSFMGAATDHIDSALSNVYSLPLAETPEILELIERKLAAGYLLLEEYGQQAEGTDKDGQKKIDWAEEELAKIVSGKVQLLDSSDEALDQTGDVTMSGWPNDSTGTDLTTDKDDPPKFEVGQEF